jgi:MinD-like ATPase involved in chromosome partitioning or flagellar assembly
METITFYSYKGGAGRSLALANAAVYLAKLGFSVVALDFDLEAPGLHYKFSRDESGLPLVINKGVVDYVNEFIVRGKVESAFDQFITAVPIPGIEKPLVHLMPAGRAPSSDYWSKLSRISWHDLFYKKGAHGVQIFKELQARILAELRPNFLLIDSRTGITEMGGVATTLLADKVLCLVLPTSENLEGARAVLRSLKRSKREIDIQELDVMVAVSRLPGLDTEDERDVIERILSVLNQDADDGKDTLTLKEVFVLHSEAALQVREALRVGAGTNPDDSILLRDYLRLFAPFVPRESIEPKLKDLIERAWTKLRDDPDAAVKDMEQYAESFGHPETYRELLRFYQVRNAPPPLILRRAQRIWEITRDSGEQFLWSVVNRHFEVTPLYQRKPNDWQPNLEFLRAVWLAAGARDPKFGIKLADAYSFDDKETLAADVLLEIIRTSEPSSTVISRCVFMLDTSGRNEEAEALIQRFKASFGTDVVFVNAWGRHVLRLKDKAGSSEITKLPVIPKLNPSLAALLYSNAGNLEEAAGLSSAILSEIVETRVSHSDIAELSGIFRQIGRLEEFENAVERAYPGDARRARERARLLRGRQP